MCECGGWTIDTWRMLTRTNFFYSWAMVVIGLPNRPKRFAFWKLKIRGVGNSSSNLAWVHYTHEINSYISCHFPVWSCVSFSFVFSFFSDKIFGITIVWGRRANVIQQINKRVVIDIPKRLFCTPLLSSWIDHLKSLAKWEKTWNLKF